MAREAVSLRPHITMHSLASLRPIPAILLLLCATEDLDPREATRGRRVPDPHDLIRLALAAERRAENVHGVGPPDPGQAPPERGRYTAVVRLLDDPPEPPVFDPSGLRGTTQIWSLSLAPMPVA